MAKARLIPDGDIQLWLYSDQGWDIPICVQPCHIEGGHADLVAVWPALLMAPEPTRIITMAMDSRQAVSSLGCWVITMSKIKSCALKCEGITPAYYFKKDGKRIEHSEHRGVTVSIEPDASPPPSDVSSVEKLAKFLSTRTALFSQGEATAVLGALASLAHEILLKRLKPIELGFCRIRAVPFRVGWQSLVHSAHPVPANADDTRIEHEIQTNGLVDVTLHSADLMHTSKHRGEGIVHWNLEIDWTTSGEKEMIVHERESLESYGPPEYAAAKCRIIDRLSSTILEMWRSWLRKASAPRGSVSDSRAGGGQTISSKRGAGRLSAFPLEQPLQRLGHIEKNWFKKSERLSLPPAPADVPQVSDVQPQAVVMRDAGSDLRDGRGDAQDGVLVPHAAEGFPEHKVLDV